MKKLRREHRRRRCFFTVTLVAIADHPDWDEFVCQATGGGNAVIASFTPAVVPEYYRAISKGPLRLRHCRRWPSCTAEEE